VLIIGASPGLSMGSVRWPPLAVKQLKTAKQKANQRRIVTPGGYQGVGFSQKSENYLLCSKGRQRLGLRLRNVEIQYFLFAVPIKTPAILLYLTPVYSPDLVRGMGMGPPGVKLHRVR
jgi:hypothetical protein